MVYLSYDKQTYSIRIRCFFSELGHVAKLRRKLSAVAFSKGYEKLSYKAFQEISSELIDLFYNDFHSLKFHGLRLLAIDGTVLILPRIALTIKEFGDNVLSDNGKWIKAQVSVLCDIVNNVCIAGEIGPYKEAEYLQAERLMSNVGKGDLLLFDRGYFSRKFLWKTYQTGANFCFRVQVNACREVQNSIANKHKDKDVSFYTPEGTVTVRITRVTLDTGEYKYFVTNLFVRHIYTCSILKKIYYMRWGVEEYYKDMKHAVCMENYAGKKPNSIKQEFYANIITYNLAMMGFSNSIERKANQGKKKCRYKTNKRALLAKLKQCFTYLFCVPDQNAQIISDIIETVTKESVPIRLGRKLNRQKTYKVKRKTIKIYTPVI